MLDLERAVKDYKKTLYELDRNDKLKINVLTILAEDYSKWSQQIVKLIEDSILETDNVALKLTRLYIIDSIAKNVKTPDDYAAIFSENLAKIFLHVFQRSDEKTRKSLYKLRNTWDGVFARGKIYLLDVEVHNVDPNWPIVNPKSDASQQPDSRNAAPPATVPESTSRTSRTASPKAEDADKRPINNGTATSGSKSKIYVNPNFVKQEGAEVNDQPPEKKRREESSVQAERQASKTSSASNSVPQEKPVHPRTHHRQAQHRRPTPPVEGRRSPKMPMKVIEPTDAPGLHAFNIPPLIPPPVVTTAIPMGAPVTTTMGFMAMTHTTVSAPEMGYSRHFLPPPQIRNETPRLPNLPSNNRIFVDGRAYEVFYLDNIAVIERNGVPHRISFSGPPRDVIIDGLVHQLAFGETKPVMIDGRTHYIRFGAPSRELYMGDFPFKGAFGGPPIAATINGRRHEIRLGGPPPEVKIEQDPCYELTRHLQNLRQNSASDLPPPKKGEKDKIGDLLEKLKSAGVLDSLADIKSTEKTGSSNAFVPSARREPAQLVTGNVRLGKFETRNEALSPLSRFDMSDLKMRYLHVIRNIYQKHSTCPECGIYFEDINSINYQNHTDAHVEVNLNLPRTVHPKGKSRQRFLTEKEWVSYSKVDEVNRAPKIPVLEDESNSDNSDIE